MKMIKQILYSIALAGIVMVAPQRGSADPIQICTINVTFGQSKQCTARGFTSTFNSTSIQGTLWYDWFGLGTGASSTLVTALTGSPGKMASVTYCNNNLGNPQPAGPVTVTAVNQKIDKFCPNGQKGSASEHWAYADP